MMTHNPSPNWPTNWMQPERFGCLRSRRFTVT